MTTDSLVYSHLSSKNCALSFRIRQECGYFSGDHCEIFLCLIQSIACGHCAAMSRFPDSLYATSRSARYDCLMYAVHVVMFQMETVVMDWRLAFDLRRCSSGNVYQILCSIFYQIGYFYLKNVSYEVAISIGFV
jgi:hypothetical protein